AGRGAGRHGAGAARRGARSALPVPARHRSRARVRGLVARPPPRRRVRGLARPRALPAPRRPRSVHGPAGRGRGRGARMSVRVERDGAVATIWLDRPEKRNAMTYAMWAGLGATCAELGADADVRVVVLRGAGGNFCAGADIGELLAERPPGTASFHD